jgi:hypothetical protein
VYLHLVLAFPRSRSCCPRRPQRSGILIHIYDEVFTLAAVPRGAEIAKAVMLALSSIQPAGLDGAADRRQSRR